ncbi:unnamed protein product [Merluccius merluccius]
MPGPPCPDLSLCPDHSLCPDPSPCPDHSLCLDPYLYPDHSLCPDHCPGPEVRKGGTMAGLEPCSSGMRPGRLKNGDLL